MRFFLRRTFLSLRNILLKIPKRFKRLLRAFLPIGLPKRLDFALVAYFHRLLCAILDLLGIAEWYSIFWHAIRPRSRPLLASEIEEAERVFQGIVPYELILVDEGSPLAKLAMRLAKTKSMGLGNLYTIQFTRKIEAKAGSNDMAWLVHELMHIAQTEHVGCRYLLEAIWAQHTDGYDYGGAEGLEARALLDFNREQQARIVEDFYFFTLFDRKHKRHGKLSLSDFESHVEATRSARF